MQIRCKVTSHSGVIRIRVVREAGERRLETIRYHDSPHVEFRDTGGSGSGLVAITDPGEPDAYA